jgi:hypothetical protein
LGKARVEALLEVGVAVAEVDEMLARGRDLELFGVNGSG